MIRLLRAKVVVLGAIVALAGAAEIVLGRLARRGRGPDPSMHMTVVVDAPIERVWAYVADVERQPEWMREMKEVRLLTPGPVGSGTRGEATVRIAGITVTDPVTVDLFEPPRRFGIRHEGLFGGGGVITLVPLGSGARTAVHWEERLVPPILPRVGALVARPVLSRIFQDDMDRLREIVESGADSAGGAGVGGAGTDVLVRPDPGDGGAAVTGARARPAWADADGAVPSPTTPARA